MHKFFFTVLASLILLGGFQTVKTNYSDFEPAVNCVQTWQHFITVGPNVRAYNQNGVFVRELVSNTIIVNHGKRNGTRTRISHGNQTLYVATSRIGSRLVYDNCGVPFNIESD